MEQAKVESDIEAQLIEQALLEALHALGSWFGEDGLRDNLTTEITRDLAATRDNGVCTMELSNGGWAIVYIAPTSEFSEPGPMPEAHVRHRNFPLRDERELKRLAEEVREHLGPYRPEKVLAFTCGNEPLFDCKPDLHVVAGLIDELRLPPDANPPAQLRLEEPASLEFYDMYHGWYEEFWRRRPNLKDEIQVETRDDIAECYEAGGVRLVYLDGEPCGMLAAQPRVEFALRGWRMRERVLAPKWWGQGLSTPALVAFAGSLRHTSRDAIWGTIHPANPWSFKTAQRAGRRITGTLHEISG